MNVVTQWIVHHTELGATRRAMLDSINARLDTNYTRSRLSEWERGARALPPAVHLTMIEDILPDLVEDIANVGLDEVQVRTLREAIQHEPE